MGELLERKAFEMPQKAKNAARLVRLKGLSNRLMNARLKHPLNEAAPTAGAGQRAKGSTFMQYGPEEGDYGHGGIAEGAELHWKCTVCGGLKTRSNWILGPCPVCGAPQTQRDLVYEG